MMRNRCGLGRRTSSLCGIVMRTVRKIAAASKFGAASSDCQRRKCVGNSAAMLKNQQDNWACLSTRSTVKAIEINAVDGRQIEVCCSYPTAGFVDGMSKSEYLLVKIFGYLTEHGFQECRLACKKWYEDSKRLPVRQKLLLF